MAKYENEAQGQISSARKPDDKQARLLTLFCNTCDFVIYVQDANNKLLKDRIYQKQCSLATELVLMPRFHLQT